MDHVGDMESQGDNRGVVLCGEDRSDYTNAECFKVEYFAEESVARRLNGSKALQGRLNFLRDESLGVVEVVVSAKLYKGIFCWKAAQ